MALVYAPPLSGATTWVASAGRGWLDGTQMAIDAGLHSPDWCRESCPASESEAHFKAIDEFFEDYADHKIVATVFYDKIPDMVVLIDENVHRAYVSQSSGPSWRTVFNIRAYLKQMCNRFGVVSVSSFAKAAENLGQRTPFAA